MSSIEVQNLSFEEREELACSYAMLLLHEIGSEITVSTLLQDNDTFFDQSDKIQELLKATNNEVDELTTRCFAKAMQQQNCDSLISNLGAERPTVDTNVVAKKETGKKIIGKSSTVHHMVCQWTIQTASQRLLGQCSKMMRKLRSHKQLFKCRMQYKKSRRMQIWEAYLQMIVTE